MTCIVYRDGVLVADSWVLDVWTKIGRFPKIAKREGAHGTILLAASGDSGYSKNFLDWGRGPGLLDWIKKGDEVHEGIPNLGEGDRTANGMLIMPDGSCIRFDPGSLPYVIKAPFYAMGSGCWVALGALEAGATAEEAVLAAEKWDVGTNGPLITLRH
ncbi:peptidase HslV family [Caulobacter phage CcrBL9]|uniref:Putative NTN hydrolase domain protein n=1 Tax=Caulobacter phage CcrBL9 TaxID=2283270 RepID=A0A385ECG6_9CAUD|nr:peptidase HslV family [Caulobacter phage CcrBL9]AXQ69376.1 putative NTN hydrolase domain protein [Caulobacter phage CcrBL9]